MFSLNLLRSPQALQANPANPAGTVEIDLTSRWYNYPAYRDPVGYMRLRFAKQWVEVPVTPEDAEEIAAGLVALAKELRATSAVVPFSV